MFFKVKRSVKCDTLTWSLQIYFTSLSFSQQSRLIKPAMDLYFRNRIALNPQNCSSHTLFQHQRPSIVHLTIAIAESIERTLRPSNAAQLTVSNYTKIRYRYRYSNALLTQISIIFDTKIVYILVECYDVIMKQRH